MSIYLVLKKCTLHCVSTISSWPDLSLWPGLTYLIVIVVPSSFCLWPTTHTYTQIPGRRWLLGGSYKRRMKKLESNNRNRVDIAEQIDSNELLSLNKFSVGDIMDSLLSFSCGKWLLLCTGEKSPWLFCFLPFDSGYSILPRTRKGWSHCALT